MKCPQCNSNKIIKNGYRRKKQSYRCRQCGRQFVEFPKIKPYSPEIKRLCLKMYLNGMGLRGIEQITEIHHTTIINWIKEAKTTETELPDVPENKIPQNSETDKS